MKAAHYLRRHLSELLLIVLPFLARLPLLAGLLDPSPLLYYARLSRGIAPGLIAGEPTIDPNIGFTSHALGYRAARMLASGRLPWWNPFEGIGMPLAGEMQSAALFPPTWLQLLPDGQLLEHILLQVIAGLSTYALLRALKLHPLAALAGAAVYEFNGIFAWLANAVCNPVPFLPLLLYGIERAVAGAQAQRRQGQVTIALAVALSLYAGFPEIAYLNGLFAAAWSLVRLVQLRAQRPWRLVGTLALGAVAGTLLAAPALVPFLDFLPYSSVGPHDSLSFTGEHLAPVAAAAVPLPYVFGTIFSPGSAGFFWDRVGGYSGALLLVMAVAGLFGRRERGIRLLAGCWTLGCLLQAFGLFDGAWLGRIVPGLAYVWLVRYLPASWLLCMTILAGFALSDLVAQRRRAPIYAGVVVLAAVVCLPLLLAGEGPVPLPNRTSLLLCGFGIAMVVALLLCLDAKRVGGIVAGLLIVEAIALFEVPVLANPRAGRVDLAGVAYLQAHIGLHRFATLGPLAANYGAYFGLASVNYNDLPAYGPWKDHVVANLDRNTDPVSYDGFSRRDPRGPSGASEVARHLPAYAAVGVRYVVTNPRQPVPGLRRVFAGPAMDIYELPSPAPYFEAPGCTIVARDRETVATRCAAPTRLIRREAWMPGWTVGLNGRSHPVARAGPIFQSIALPRGDARLTFAYEPPYIRWAWLSAGAALLLLLWSLLAERRRSSGPLRLLLSPLPPSRAHRLR